MTAYTFAKGKLVTGAMSYFQVNVVNFGIVSFIARFGLLRRLTLAR